MGSLCQALVLVRCVDFSHTDGFGMDALLTSRKEHHRGTRIGIGKASQVVCNFTSSCSYYMLAFQRT
eukprot:3113660-Amphidinium_carterae.1